MFVIPPKITKEWLKTIGACDRFIMKFNIFFPQGSKLSPKLFDILNDHEVHWVCEKAGLLKEWDIYWARCKPIMDKFRQAYALKQEEENCKYLYDSFIVQCEPFLQKLKKSILQHFKRKGLLCLQPQN